MNNYSYYVFQVYSDINKSWKSISVNSDIFAMRDIVKEYEKDNLVRIILRYENTIMEKDNRLW